MSNYRFNNKNKDMMDVYEYLNSIQDDPIKIDMYLNKTFMNQKILSTSVTTMNKLVKYMFTHCKNPLSAVYLDGVKRVITALFYKTNDEFYAKLKQARPDLYKYAVRNIDVEKAHANWIKQPTDTPEQTRKVNETLSKIEQEIGPKYKQKVDELDIELERHMQEDKNNPITYTVDQIGSMNANANVRLVDKNGKVIFSNKNYLARINEIDNTKLINYFKANNYTPVFYRYKLTDEEEKKEVVEEVNKVEEPTTSEPAKITATPMKMKKKKYDDD